MSARISVGIDLGTTNSAGAFVVDGGEPRIAPTVEGERLTPSELFISKGGEVLVGRSAQRSALLDPERHFQHVKRDMGDPEWSRALDGRTYTPPLLSSFILSRVIQDVARAAGTSVEEGVVTVPAYFGDLERGATIDAARIAGLARVHMLNEPTAAALSFGLDPDAIGDQTMRAVVYDLGGGTFDVTVAELSRGRVRVLATAGERRLGGKDWDDELINLVCERAHDARGLDPREEPIAIAELRERVERAKFALGERLEATVVAPLPGGESFTCDVTRADFESRTRGLLEQTATQLELALAKAKLAWSDVDAVLPVGGATRMPMVRALLRRVSGKEPLALLDPDTAVARGAAIYAALLARGDRLEVDASGATPSPPRRAGSGSRPALPRRAPSSIDIASPEDQEEEELPLLPGLCRVPEVQDVVAHALGVLVMTKRGGKNAVLIPEQTPVPVERSRQFLTIRKDQTAVCVKVLEGQDADPDGCSLIGTLVVDGLPPDRPRGQRIEVTYRYDEDGRVQVSARDLATGKAARATIERRGAIAEDEIARLRVEVAKRVSS